MKKLTKILSLIVLVVSLFSLTACFPKDFDSAKQKMEDAGYYVNINEYKDYKLHGIVSGFTAFKLDENNQKQTVIVIYFESAQKAQEYAKDWRDSIFIVEYNGKFAYAGTQSAIDDLKK